MSLWDVSKCKQSNINRGVPTEPFNIAQLVKLLLNGAVLSVIAAVVRCAYERLTFWESILYAVVSTGAGTLAYYTCHSAGFSDVIVISCTIGTSLVAREVVGILVESMKRLGENPLLTVLTVISSLTSTIPKFKKQLENEEEDRKKKKTQKD